ncbi:metallophosphoesterase family protein [Desulfurobacterium sp.]|uniref:metallophosphoesterase family protein n=1 Tax=Desulfurobacterium sp. TaxID=2004706 RepID=UPI002614F88B|nr:metallophosphoesterase family protein [Desulfurobacterium sp.]
MMKIGIISDIHANLHALEAVAKDMDLEGIDEVWCLGDTINYGAFPNECCQWVIENVSSYILGNHELMLLGLASVENRYVNACLKWTKQVIREDYIEYFATKSVIKIFDDVTLVHDNPLSPGSMRYILTRGEAEEVLLKSTAHVCFFGHTHIPIGYRLSTVGAEIIKTPVYTIDSRKHLINPGSVGQPRDGMPLASYIVLQDNTLRLKRIKYDVKGAAKAIIEANLPTIMAARLLEGV